MRATFETFSDSSTGPLSGFRSKGAMRHPDVYSLPATECLCCGSMEGLHACAQSVKSAQAAILGSRRVAAEPRFRQLSASK
jgi:hypothetical protein